MSQLQGRRLSDAIAGHLACARRIDSMDDVAEATRLANETGDELEDAAFYDFHRGRPKHRDLIIEARRAMSAALQRLNQRSLRAGQIAMIDEACAWSRSVSARVPGLMRMP